MSILADKTANVRQWIKNRDTPAADRIYRLVKGARGWSMPSIRPIHAPLYLLHRSVLTAFNGAKRTLWVTPLFLSQLEAPAPRINLYGTLPLIQGNVRIRCGADCRIGGRINLTGRSASRETPEIVIGDNCDIGYMNILNAGGRIVIGNNVRLAAFVHLVGYPGHPLDTAARAHGDADTDDQVGDIILEDDVWLATRVTVNRGVRIGRGTIVATGSVVTTDLPPFVLAAGVPARIIKKLDQPAA